MSIRFLPIFVLAICSLAACETSQSTKEVLIKDDTRALYDPSLKPFYHGVASGDPLANAVIIWTRITRDYVEELEISWAIARDERFEQMVGSGKAKTGPAQDYTVKVDVQGLEPDTYYYYRFQHGKSFSTTGRTKTTPVSPTDALKLAFISCSNYEGGYFNAYRTLAKQEGLDAVVHLGDYIYEYGPKTYGDTTLERKHLPAREIISLQDYRTRYAQYRLDKDLQLAHQMHPFIAIWDDHEIANDSYVDGAQNHQPNEGDYEARKKAAVKAYFEWLPIRENPDQKIYRHFSLGPMADLFMLDGRLEGRVVQAKSVDEVGFDDEHRTMLGKEQYQWLTTGLAGSKATWKLIGNQVIFADLDISPFGWGSPVNLDSWDGYPSEKRKLISFFQEKQLNNLLFLTGDTHCSWAFEVPANREAYQKNGSSVVALELGTPSISSANIDEYAPRDTVLMAEKIMASPKLNSHLKYVNLRDHGYLILSLTPDKALASWHFVEALNVPTENETIGNTVTIRSGLHKLQ